MNDSFVSNPSLLNKQPKRTIEEKFSDIGGLIPTIYDSDREANKLSNGIVIARFEHTQDYAGLSNLGCLFNKLGLLTNESFIKMIKS